MNFKIGATFAFGIVFEEEDADGVWQPVDMTGWTGRGQVRAVTGDALIASVPLVWVNSALGQARWVAVGATSAWPLGKAVFDIEMTTPLGEIGHTETVSMVFVRGPTRAVV